MSYSMGDIKLCHQALTMQEDSHMQYALPLLQDTTISAPAPIPQQGAICSNICSSSALDKVPKKRMIVYSLCLSLLSFVFFLSNLLVTFLQDILQNNRLWEFLMSIDTRNVTQDEIKTKDAYVFWFLFLCLL